MRRMLWRYCALRFTERRDGRWRSSLLPQPSESTRRRCPDSVVRAAPLHPDGSTCQQRKLRQCMTQFLRWQARQRFQAKRPPVRVKKTREYNNLENFHVSMNRENTLARRASFRHSGAQRWRPNWISQISQPPRSRAGPVRPRRLRCVRSGLCRMAGTFRVF